MHQPEVNLPYAVRVQRTFVARHAIRLHDGSVEQPHAHDWRLTVVVGCEQLDPLGMVMDFHALEQIVDQALAPARDADFNALADFGTETGQVNPTAEHIALWLGRRIGDALPDAVRLISVRLREAPGCEAVWQPR
jgi:6-pyruvoyl-tetrahydropterin synthase